MNYLVTEQYIYFYICLSICLYMCVPDTCAWKWYQIIFSLFNLSFWISHSFIHFLSLLFQFLSPIYLFIIFFLFSLSYFLSNIQSYFLFTPQNSLFISLFLILFACFVYVNIHVIICSPSLHLPLPSLPKPQTSYPNPIDSYLATVAGNATHKKKTQTESRSVCGNSCLSVRPGELSSLWPFIDLFFDLLDLVGLFFLLFGLFGTFFL